MRLVRLMLVAALCAGLSSCGSGGGESGSSAASTMPTVPSVTQFPKVRGRTMNQLAARVQAGPALAPAVSLLLPGTNRFGFGLFDRQRKQITDAPGALYISRGADAVAHGPYVARYETLAVKRRYLSHTVQSDPDAAQTLYVADLPFRKPGKYAVLGIFRLDNRLVGAGTTVEVMKDTDVPQPGQPAIKIDTPTKDSVAGDLSKIDTRSPHDDMHDVNFADALGKRPIVLLFATPALCQSRVCGPVVDIAEQVLVEIYNNNNLNDGYRPQFLAYHLPQEPWLFTINRHGKVAAELQGAYSASELQKAVDAAQKG